MRCFDRAFRCVLVSIAVLLTSARPFAQSNGSEKSAASSRYVGAEVCEGCHEDQYKSFAASGHAATLRNKAQAEQGCEGCHGPGAEHVAAGDPERIRRFSTASPATIQEVCTTCHAANLGEAHMRARLTCLTCHSAHHYQGPKAILVEPQLRLCRRCHRP